MRWLTLRQLKSKKAESRRKALEKLASEEDPDLFDLALAASGDADPAVRKAAVECMGKAYASHPVDAFVRALKDRHEEVRLVAADVLLRIRRPETVDALADALRDSNSAVRARAAIALDMLGWQPKTNDQRVALLVNRGKVAEAVEFGAAAIPALVAVLKEGVYYKRQEAVQALGRIKDPGVVKLLIEALRDPETIVRNSAIEGLADIGDARAVEPLIHLLRDKDDKVRAVVVRALSKLGDARAVEPLTSVLRDANWDVRLAAIESLARFKDARTVRPLLECMKDKDQDVRLAAVEALGKTGDADAIEALVTALTDESNLIRDAAAVALKKTDPHWERTPGAKAAVPALEKAQKSTEYWIRTSATEILAKIQPKTETQTATDLTTFANPAYLKRQAATRALVAALKHCDRDIRQAAAEALGQLGAPDTLQPLAEALADSDEWVRRGAAESLEKQPWLPASKLQRAQQLTVLGRWDALAELGEEILPPVFDLLNTGGPAERAGAIAALRGVPGEKAATALAGCLQHKDAAVRIQAARALDERKWIPADNSIRAVLALEAGRWDDLPTFGATAVKPLLDALRRRVENAAVARQAAVTLGRLRGEGVVAGLLEAVADPAVAQDVVAALEGLFSAAPQSISVEELEAVTRLERVPCQAHQFDDATKTFMRIGSTELDCAALRQMAGRELTCRGHAFP